MHEKRQKKVFYFLVFGFVISVFFTGTVCAADMGLDKSKYITIDEIQPGMEAYCLTSYKDTKVEKFGLEVLSVVRNIAPGRNAILVQGTDERFIHTGPVAGCSGSPVYINGRLAGALAFGWHYSKDPVYGVTPIDEILRIGQGGSESAAGQSVGFTFDFSKPIDFDEIDRQMTATLSLRRNTVGGASALPCPLVISGLPPEVCEHLSSVVEPLGFMAVAGIGGGTNSNAVKNAALVPGACLAVPLVSGDITMEIIGTVTEVVGDKVYGFGHGFLGYGPIDLPMATGQIHTVVSNVVRSFKVGSAVEIVGAVTVDEYAAIRGQLGAKAKMIPLTIKVERYNDPQKRVYNCQMAYNRLVTPVMLREVVEGAAFMLGGLPPDHMLEYKVNVGIEGAEPVSFANVSTTLGIDELLRESGGSVAIIMNNPYEKVNIESIEVDIRIVPKNIVAHLWSVDLADSKVKAGDELNIDVVIESFLGGKEKYQCSLKVPENLSAGKYDLVVLGGYEYRDFLIRATPYKFVPQNINTLVGMINELLTIRKDKLYCLLIMPPRGVAIENAELPDLPATKALVLGDAKRTLRARPYPRWLEKSLPIGTIVIDKKVIQITVEK